MPRYTAALLLVVLPLLALGACVLGIRARGACWPVASLGGAVTWGVALVAITEGLSLAGSLTVQAVAGAWLALLLVVISSCLRSRGQLDSARARAGAWRDLLRSIGWLDAVLLGPLVVLVAVLGGTAVISPPNTWDSMTYHMARLIHWAQAATLAPYPTHILRQLYLQPGAEFVLLHLQLLSGGDHLAGLVQWGSMVGTLVAAASVARALGAHQAGARCATLFAASLPIGILESTSTQNDYVVAFWSLSAAFFGLRLTRSPRMARPWAAAAAFGASTGLALLTKAIAYLIVLPLGLWVAVWLTRRCGWRGVGMLVLAGGVALALNLGFYSRNVLVFASPVGPLDEGAPSLRYVNDALTPSLLVSNVVRDVGVNLNATPLAAVNVRAVNFVRLVHTWLATDIADPRTTWGEQVFQEQPAGLAFDENFASNPLHLVLVLMTLALVWPLRRVLSSTLIAYALGLTCSCMLFAAALRWQPWDTRLELPLFMLAAPLVGTVAERLAPRLAVVLAGALVVCTLPWVVYNQARPLVGPRSILAVGRDDQYFTNRPGLRPAYLDMVTYLRDRGCAHVGFVSTVDGWEYPLWPLLNEQGPGGVLIEHVRVGNVSAAQATAANRDFEPCAVLALGPAAESQSIDVNGRAYQSTWDHLDPTDVLEQLSVLTPTAETPAQSVR